MTIFTPAQTRFLHSADDTVNRLIELFRQQGIKLDFKLTKIEETAKVIPLKRKNKGNLKVVE